MEQRRNRESNANEEQREGGSQGEKVWVVGGRRGSEKSERKEGELVVELLQASPGNETRANPQPSLASTAVILCVFIFLHEDISTVL